MRRKDKVVWTRVEGVWGLWITTDRVEWLRDIHKEHRNDQLLNTFSSELKSRVSSLLVVFNSAILRQACSTVV